MDRNPSADDAEIAENAIAFAGRLLQVFRARSRRAPQVAGVKTNQRIRSSIGIGPLVN